jgi:hypothetical protein
METKRCLPVWKSTILFALLAVLSAAPAGPILITAQSHHIWGLAVGSEGQEAFDITGADPVSAVASAWWWNDSSPYTPENPVLNEVAAAAGNFGVYAADRSGWIFTGCHAFAESSYWFKPLDNSILLEIDGTVELHEFENAVSFALYDVTNASELVSQTWTTEETIRVQWSQTLFLNPEYEYRLDLHAHVYPGDVPGVTSSLTAAFVVPEPITAVFFAAAAMFLRKKPR